MIWQEKRNQIINLIEGPENPDYKEYSIAQLFALVPKKTRSIILNTLEKEEEASLLYDWGFWARPKQLTPPGDWFLWLILSGRGFGKTRTGAEWILERVALGYKRIALVGQTKADVRDTMIELEESSIMKIAPPWLMPKYIPSKRRLIWERYGATATAFSGDEPGQLRGPQHDTAWVDELAKFKYPEETLSNLELGLRLGEDPRGIITTTPRPIKVIKDLVADSDVHTTRGSTYENAGNLADRFIQRVVKRYEGTRLGRQELGGEILDDAPGALWSRDNVEKNRVTQIPPMLRIVVGVDPPGKKTAAECGIVAAGIGEDGLLYVLMDSSLHGKPHEWGREVVTTYIKVMGDKVIAESNFGGEMVEETITAVDNRIPVKLVHASRGKAIRAEPISALSEQDKIKFFGSFPVLEDELCQWEPVPSEGAMLPSPNRLDAFVWAIHALAFDDQGELKTDIMFEDDSSGIEISPY